MAMEQKAPTLPNTSYVVLGLLSFGEELSGYEIRKWAQNLRFFYWSPAQSQLYAELQRLEAAGFVQAREVLQADKPNKRLYQITPQGSAALTRWLSEESGEPTVIKHSVALKLYFGHMTTSTALVAMLTRYIEETKALMGQLGVVQEYMDDDPRFRYAALTAEWSYRYYEAELAMAQKLVAQLQQPDNNNELGE